MKKIILTFLILSISFLNAFADEITLEDNFSSDQTNNEVEILYEEPVEPDISPYSKEALKGIIEKDYDLNSTDGMFKDQLKYSFKKGIIKDVETEIYFQGNLQDTYNENNDFKYNTRTITTGLRGDFRNEKERYNFLFNFTPTHENFFHKVLLDAWIETKRIPHHTLLFGTSRPMVGLEGGQSSYTLPFMTRSQIARNIGNARKTGIRLKGNYDFVDYEIGGYSSDTEYTEFFPGVESDIWVNFKPLAKTEGKYGNLGIAGGIATGQRNSHDFFVTSTAIAYDYKKFWIKSELQNAQGSNGGSGITEKNRWGYNVTLAYRLTKKIEALARYDDFNPDKSISNNNTKEYSLGLNYYILGQTAKLILNYIFVQNESASDSHKIILGTQILL